MGEFNTKFIKLDCQVVSNSYEKLNSQFAKVKIKVAYPGKNRNKTKFSKELLQHMANTSLLNIPVVGEWKEEKNDFGSHGGKLEIDDEGFRFIDTTRPYGVVPSDTEITWETIREKDGLTENEYLCCTAILWVGRYPECEKILDDGANQSMEVLIHSALYDEDDYLEILDAEFSALCILGNDVEPCFEKADINSYSLDAFKIEFNKMLSEYKQYSNKSNKKEGGTSVKDKIVSILSAYVFKNDIGQELNKYIHLSTTENEVNIIDREDDYKVYSIAYTVEKDENGEENGIVLDFDNKVEKSIATGDKTDDYFSLKNEVDSVCSAKVSFAIDSFESAIVNEMTEKVAEWEGKFTALEKEYNETKIKLEEFEIAKTEAENALHKTEIDSVITEFEKKLNNNSEFLMYRTKLDYSKSVEQVKTDLTLVLGRANLNSKKSGYSYSPTTFGAGKEFDKSDSNHSRYGDLFEKIKK